MNDRLEQVWRERVNLAHEYIDDLGHEPRTRHQLTQAAITAVDEVYQAVKTWHKARWEALVAMQCDEELRWHEKAREVDDALRRLDDLLMGGLTKD